MKNVQTFALGVLVGALIIACGGGAADNAGNTSGPSTVKIDAGQMDQLIKAVKGTDIQWEYNVCDFKSLKKFGDEGWTIVQSQKTAKGALLYVMTRPKK